MLQCTVSRFARGVVGGRSSREHWAQLRTMRGNSVVYNVENLLRTSWLSSDPLFWNILQWCVHPTIFPKVWLLAPNALPHKRRRRILRGTSWCELKNREDAAIATKKYKNFVQSATYHFMSTVSRLFILSNFHFCYINGCFRNKLSFIGLLCFFGTLKKPVPHRAHRP